MNHSTGKPTKREAERIEAMMRLGCVACAFIELWCPADECHHMLEGGIRMGHWFTLPLCRGHHRGIWRIEQQEMIPAAALISIADGRKRFNAVYGSERELWERLQDRLHLPKLWPLTKILPRAI